MAHLLAPRDRYRSYVTPISIAVVEELPGRTLRHVLRDGAHWLRVIADRGCTATATFMYE